MQEASYWRLLGKQPSEILQSAFRRILLFGMSSVPRRIAALTPSTLSFLHSCVPRWLLALQKQRRFPETEERDVLRATVAFLVYRLQRGEAAAGPLSTVPSYRLQFSFSGSRSKRAGVGLEILKFSRAYALLSLAAMCMADGCWRPMPKIMLRQSPTKQAHNSSAPRASTSPLKESDETLLSRSPIFFSEFCPRCSLERQFRKDLAQTASRLKTGFVPNSADDFA